MQLNPSEISELIKSKIQSLNIGAETRTQGTVVSLTDGICRVHGLANLLRWHAQRQSTNPRACSLRCSSGVARPS